MTDIYLSDSIILEENQEGYLSLHLRRKDKHNALNPEMIESLLKVLSIVKNKQKDFSFLVLLSHANHFCAGADLAYMKAQNLKSFEENLDDAKRLAHIFYSLASLDIPVVAFVHGASIGAGLGLLTCCDYVLAVESAKFATTEVRLGLVPSVIGPYLVRKLGVSQSQAIMLSGKSFDAYSAKSIGLIHAISSDQEFEPAKSELIEHFLTLKPHALKQTKTLLLKTSPLPNLDMIEYTSRLIAKVRISREAQDGMQGFFEKRS